MAGLTAAELEAVVGVDDRPFASGLDGMLGMLRGWSGSAGKIVAGVGVGMAAAFTGAAIVGVKQFAALESGMNEVFTLLPGISQSAMDDMTDDVKAFSKEFGVLPDKVVPALYQALSAGVPPDNVFAYLEVAQKAAKGGVTDLETAVDGISSVVNAYGEDVIDAAGASDLMFTAVKLGKTNFEELSGSLYNVIPTASALGVEFGDVTAALAAMTSQGTPTSVATTQMRQMLVELSKEGTATSETFENIAGKSFKQFVAEGGNVQGALQLLEEHAEKSGMGVNDLFGSVEAGSAALALTGKGTDKFADALAGMEDSAGATDTAFKQMDQGLSASWDKIVATVVVGITDLGDALAPMVQDFADFAEVALPVVIAGLSDLIGVAGDVGDAIGTVTGFLEDHETAVLVVAGIIAAVYLPTLVAMGTASLVNGAKAVAGWAMQKAAALGWAAVHSVVVALTVAGWVVMGAQAMANGARIAAAWLLALGPVGLVIAGLVAVGAGFVILWKKSETFRKIMTAGMDAVGAAGRWLWNNALAPAFRFIVNGIATILDMWAKMLGSLAKVPGFGWAKNAADAMANAAGKARGLADNIKDIPERKVVNIDIFENVTRRRSNEGSGGGFGAVPGLATGGRVTGATLAVIGEGREPESVLPDSVLRGLLERAHDAGASKGGRDERGRLFRDVVFAGRDGASARELVGELSHALRVADHGGVYA